MNIIGKLDKVGEICNKAKKGFITRGIFKLIRFQIRSARRNFKTGNLLNVLGDWLKESDFIVKTSSQNMGSVYPNNNHKTKLVNQTTGNGITGLFASSHMDIATGVGVKHAFLPIAQDNGAGDYGYMLFAPYLICKNQPDITARRIIRNSGTQKCGNSLVPDIRHTFICFDGMCGTPEQRWLSPENNGEFALATFRPTSETGKPVKVAVYLHDYFMNNFDFTINLNNNTSVVPFYDVTQTPITEGVGSWASRFIDSNGDMKIDEGDMPGGAWVFVPLDTNQISQGDNLVRIEKPVIDDIVRNTKNLETIFTFKWGNPVEVFETDENGTRITNHLINKLINWSIAAGEEKRIYFGFEPEIDGNDARNTLQIVSSSTVKKLLRVYNGAPNAGQYRLFEVDGKWLMEFVIGVNQLSCDLKGEIEATQVLHITAIDNAGTPTNSYLPFFIRKDPLTIVVNAPGLKGDFNADGKVDDQDNCTTNLEMTDCENICTRANIVDDPETPENECTEAVNTCNMYSSGEGVPVSQTDCDGIDNDKDGYYDNNDLGESHNIKFYSPRYDVLGRCTNPVGINFTVSGYNQPTNKLISLKYFVYKANSISANSMDQMVYVSEEFVRPKQGRQTSVNTVWNFDPYNATNPPPEGLYYIKIEALDYLGALNSEKLVSQPAYFIIDRTLPSISILENWQDENGNPVFTPSSNTFGFKYRPGQSGYLNGPFDSETHSLKIIFKSTTSGQSFEFTNNPTYDDVLTYQQGSSFQDGWQYPDGNIDPTIFELPMGSDFTETDANALKELMASAGATEDEADETVEQYDLQMLREVLTRGSYTVTYIAEDKAGNTTTYTNPNEIISIQNGNEVPILNEDKINWENSNNRYVKEENQWQVSGKGTPGATTPTRDALNFLWIEVKDDFDLIIRVNSIETTGTHSLGLMARSSLEPNAAFTAIELQDDGDVVTTGRINSGGEKFTGITLSDKYSTNHTWIRMEREGSTVKKYVSSDGINFILVEQTTFTPETVFIGAFQTDNSGNFTNASFSILPVPLENSLPTGYGVYSLEQTTLKDRAKVFSGVAGSNGNFEMGFGAEIYGNVFAGGNFQMKGGSKIIGHLTVSGALTMDPSSFVSKNVYRPSSVPPLNIPILATKQSSNNNISIPCGWTRNLTPGEYGDVSADDRSILVFTNPGIYYFRSLSIKNQVEVRLPGTGAVEIRVANYLTIGDRSTLGTASTSPAKLLIYSDQTNTLTVGYDSYVSGRLIAPHAAVEVRNKCTTDKVSRFRGYILGRRVVLKEDVYIDPTEAF